MNLNLFLLSIFFASAIFSQLGAAYTIKDGCLVDVAAVPEMPVEDHYNAAVSAYQNEQWREAARHFYVVMVGFPVSEYSQESSFYLAICYYHLHEYDLANKTFSQYLQGKDHPRLFQEAIEYKFAIAEKFRLGARRRLFGQRQLPKWSTGGTLALSIYDEVIAALPCHDLAARALYAKAILHRSRREYRDSIDCLQMVVRRFPKHELTPECYLLINAIYLDQCRLEFQNPDILALAEINCCRFQQQFPTEERLVAAEQGILAIKEVFGRGLQETGSFYERKGAPNAAAIYYQSAIRQFPETRAAQIARCRLAALGYPISEPTIQPSESSGTAKGDLQENKAVTSEKREANEGDQAIDWIP